MAKGNYEAMRRGMASASPIDEADFNAARIAQTAKLPIGSAKRRRKKVKVKGHFRHATTNRPKRMPGDMAEGMKAMPSKVLSVEQLRRAMSGQ